MEDGEIDPEITKARNLAAADLRFVMEDERGRRFIARLLDTTGVLKASFGGDDRSTSFNEGMRRIGLVLMSDINRDCPHLYPALLHDCLMPKKKDPAPSQSVV